MTPDRVIRLVRAFDRLHSQRRGLLAIYTFLLLVCAFFLSGYMGHALASWRNRQRGLRWVAAEWTTDPMLRALGLNPSGTDAFLNAIAAFAFVGVSVAIVGLLIRDVTRNAGTRRASIVEAAVRGLSAGCVGLPCVLLLLGILHELRVFREPDIELPQLPHPGHYVWIGVGVLWALWTLALLILSSAFSPYLRALLSSVHTAFVAAAAILIGLIAFLNDAELILFIAVYASCLSVGTMLRLLFLWPAQRAQLFRWTCLRCGYDLTGTLAAGREACPECGEPIVVVEPVGANPN